MPLDKKGWEVPNKKPVEIPAGFKKPEALADQIQRLVRTEISEQAEQEGNETWEEANDFYCPEEDFPMPDSPYEEDFDPILQRSITPDEIGRHPDEFREEYLQKGVDHPAAEEAYETEKKRFKWPFMKKKTSETGDREAQGPSQKEAPEPSVKPEKNSE